MKSLSTVLLALAFHGAAFAQTQQKCFVNGGLKDEDRVYLTITGTQVTGEFVTDRGYDTANRESWRFGGTRTGNELRIKFVEGKAPDALPSTRESLVWALRATSGKEALHLNFHGKHYTSGKTGDYAVVFESCEPGYAELARTAQRVSFAKGTSSASVAVALKSKSDRKSFLLNLGKGQAASVQAIGCGIAFYYPNKKPYEEGTSIDLWGSKALPQSGDYVIVITPAGEAGTCNVTFNANQGAKQ